ncbi:HEAT repeat domain-containing protein [Enterococcus sp. BWR-S5]|nr:HEAT repeat domain-containing protein [Enterococcus sp. BWR-S5]
MIKPIYKPLEEISEKESKRILASGTVEERMLLPLRVGEYSTDWKQAQDCCLSLMDDPDERVRANAALGLAYVARTKGKLEKHKVKPILLQLLRECDAYRWRIIDSIEDINLYLGWKIGIKAMKRIQEN